MSISIRFSSYDLMKSFMKKLCNAICDSGKKGDGDAIRIGKGSGDAVRK